jgi:hypothetical protein
MAQQATPIPMNAMTPTPGSSPKLRAAVVTVSDSVFKGKRSATPRALP